MPPYIDTQSKNDVYTSGAQNVGQLTYVLTESCIEYVARKQESFQVYAEILGALEATKLELYRRLITPYEESKRLLNGDIF